MGNDWRTEWRIWDYLVSLMTVRKQKAASTDGS